MPYVPYWFEPFSAWTPWIVPVLALAGLWIARLCEDARVRSMAEACYFGAMIVASMITLRTILADDHCWLLHTASLGAMILGAIFPHHTMDANAAEANTADAQTWESSHWEGTTWDGNRHS
jgi:hypothetical protein